MQDLIEGIQNLQNPLMEHIYSRVLRRTVGVATGGFGAGDCWFFYFPITFYSPLPIPCQSQSDSINKWNGTMEAVRNLIMVGFGLNCVQSQSLTRTQTHHQQRSQYRVGWYLENPSTSVCAPLLQFQGLLLAYGQKTPAFAWVESVRDCTAASLPVLWLETLILRPETK